MHHKNIAWVKITYDVPRSTKPNFFPFYPAKWLCKIYTVNESFGYLNYLLSQKNTCGIWKCLLRENPQRLIVSKIIFLNARI